MTTKSSKPIVSGPSSSQGYPWELSRSSWPSDPGVYWFLAKNGQVLYVGKAKNLKNRLSFYRLTKPHEGKTGILVSHAQRLKFLRTDNEIDALVLEAQLVKTHQPKFNILLKDDKSPIYLYLTTDPIPRLKTARKNQIPPSISKNKLFGPFSSAFELRRLLVYVRKTFHYCQATTSQIKHKKACFYYHLDQCPGVCTGEMTSAEYALHLKQIYLFLKAKKKILISRLKKSIELHAKNQRYEEAALAKQQLDILSLKPQSTYDHTLPLLSKTTPHQGLEQLNQILRRFFPLPPKYPLERIEGYDISNIQGKWATGSMVTFIDGKPAKEHYRHFRIKTKATPDDPFMMTEMLSRRIKHPEWGIPNLILIDGGKTQLNAALKTIVWNIPILSLVKRPERLLIKRDGRWFSVPLSDNPASMLLRSIRDESHRFAKRYHHKLTIKDF